MRMFMKNKIIVDEIMVKVSVIMPVYNSVSSVVKMLNSLKSQTLKEFEVLMIDDGSNDGTENILDNFAQMDQRFKAVHKQNGGVSAARQTGLELAQGAYVIHADSDDWVDPKMLEELYINAKQNDADVVICDFFSNTDKNQILVKQEPLSLDPAEILKELFQQLHGSCWNKLVRRVCYNKYKIRFPDGVNHCEDLLTWIQLFQHPDVKVSYLPKAFYHYYNNSESITRNYTHNTYEMRLKYLSKLDEILSDDYYNLKQKAAFGVFTEAVMFNVLTRNESLNGLSLYKSEILKLKSVKWKIGFFFLFIGLNKMASKLLHY